MVTRGLWLARSPDLTPSDFYLFGCIKDNVLEDLEIAIQHGIDITTLNELGRVFECRAPSKFMIGKQKRLF